MDGHDEYNRRFSRLCTFVLKEIYSLSRRRKMYETAQNYNHMWTPAVDTCFTVRVGRFGCRNEVVKCKVLSIH